MPGKIQFRIAALFLTGATIFSSNANAQRAFGIGAGLTYFGATTNTISTSYSAGNNGFPTIGITIDPYYNLTEKMRIDAYILYFFTKDKSTSVDFPFAGTYTIDIKTGLIGFGANFQHAFLGKFRGNGIVVYGLAGFTDFSASYTETTTVSGKTIPNLFTTPGQSFLSLEIGAGAAYAVKPKFSIFLELGYVFGILGPNVAVKDILGNPVRSENLNLGGVAVNLGLRYTFGAK